MTQELQTRMRWLDHRVPPPVVALVAALLAWGAARLLPMWTRADAPPWPLMLVPLVASGLFGMSGIWTFVRARTTVNPHAPGRASSLVTGGPYRFTRNPMYLALALVLLAWCIWLANPATLVALLFFIAYLTRYQIIPEERVMREKFGAEYAAYCARVRRWF